MTAPVLLNPNPVDFVFTDASRYRNVRYGPHMDHRLDVYLNATRVAGGNPLIIFGHGGALVSFDKAYQISTHPASLRYAPGWLSRVALNSAAYGYSIHPDVVSYEYAAFGHYGTNVSAYEPQMATNVSRQSYRGHGQGFVDDTQRAWQWCADNSTRFGWNVAQFIACGYSYGAYVAMCAALQPSRAWNASGRGGRWRARSPANVRGVLNYSGEASISPWVNHHKITRYLFGMAGEADADATNIRARMERLLLIPDSSNAYPSTVDRSAYCKSLSPIDLAALAPGSRKTIKFRSYYDAQDAGTTPGSSDYAGVPPYDDGGHNKNQRNLLHTALTDNGFDHTPTDSSWLYDSGAVGVNIQAAVEATIPSTIAWIQSTIS